MRHFTDISFRKTYLLVQFAVTTVHPVQPFGEEKVLEKRIQQLIKYLFHKVEKTN